MKQEEAFILSLTAQAFRNWANGTEKPMFPITEETRATVGHMIWYTSANAMAYGFERGLMAVMDDPEP